MHDNAIAIIAAAGQFPGARSVEQFWANLTAGVESSHDYTPEEMAASGLSPITYEDPGYVRKAGILDDAALFDADFFGFSPREAQLLCPQHRKFLEVGWAVLERAGYDPHRYGGRIGVFAGADMSSYLVHNLHSHRGFIESMGFLSALFLGDKDYLATRLSYKLDLRGPSINVSTACSTSLVAVHMGVQSLLNGECEMAIAGGVRVGTVPGYRYIDGSVFSPDGHCRAFDVRAQGTYFSSGVGAVVLKPLADARRDGDSVLAVILGTALNNDGSKKVSFTAPSLDAQSDVVGEALAMADADATSIGYIEAHGTGTALGDPIEVAALTKVFRRQSDARAWCKLGSVKTNVGHLGAAAGITGLIKLIMALQHRQLPASLHFETPNPKLNLESSPFTVVTRLTAWEGPTPLRGGISALGVGGTNAHMVLQEAPALEPTSPGRPWELIAVSARSAAALDRATANLAEQLAAQPGLDLSDVAFTLLEGRHPFKHRRFVVASDAADAARALADPARVVSGRLKTAGDRPIAFMFAGGGAQYVGMGQQLYQTEPVFKRALDDACEMLREPLRLDLRSLIHGPADQAEALSAVDLPAVMAVSYAMAKLLISCGIRPQTLVGFSTGEYLAAALSGVMSIEDAFRLLGTRLRMIAELPKGGMLSVALPADQCRPWLDRGLSLACVNGPSLCVLSGPNPILDEVMADLGRQNLPHRRLKVVHAYHSAMVDPMLDRFADVVRTVTLRAPQIPYVSTVTGTWANPAEVVTPAYWVRHCRDTVQFAPAVEKLLADPDRILVEASPGNQLSTLARQAPNLTSEHVVLETMRHSQHQEPDGRFMAKALGRLWLAGSPLGGELFSGQKRRRVLLPTYPFEQRHYWVDPRRHDAASTEAIELPPPPPPAPSEADAAGDGPLVRRNFVAPSTETEKLLAAVWHEVLGVEVGIHDNFFEVGGTSLLGIQVFSKLPREVRAAVGLAQLFELQTVALLARRLDDSVAGRLEKKDPDEQIRLDAVLPADTQAVVVKGPDRPAHLLLTGATGYLGAFLLHELLGRTDAMVSCLVRADSIEEGQTRLRKNLTQYGLWQEGHARRIRALLGDIGKPRLGLSEIEHAALASSVTSIYHNAAVVNLALPYSMLRAPNVLSTVEVLRLSAAAGVIPVHFVSSVAVFASSAYFGKDAVGEDIHLEGPAGFLQAYGQSKWASEALLEQAKTRGFPVTIYRPGFLSGEARNPADVIYPILRACHALGCAPNVNLHVDITPVDYCARALVYLSQQASATGKVWHLCHPSPARWLDVVQWMSDGGEPLELLAPDDWLARAMKSERGGAVMSIVEFLAAGPRWDCGLTVAALAGSGISCQPVDRELIHKTYLAA